MAYNWHPKEVWLIRFKDERDGEKVWSFESRIVFESMRDRLNSKPHVTILNTRYILM